MVVTQSIHSESKIMPYQGGIRLLAPDHHLYSSSRVKLSELYELPLDIFLLDYNSVGVSCNRECAETNNLASENDIIGLTSYDLYVNESAMLQVAGDARAMESKSLVVSSQHATLLNDAEFDFLMFKQPWYDKDKIAGIFGITLTIDINQPEKISHDLSMLLNTGLINIQHLPINSYQASEELTYFTPREIVILQHLTRGHTAKEIGLLMNISKRTVENHIARMKDKSNCDSKSALIAKHYDFIQKLT